MAVHEKSGGERPAKLLCGHETRELGPVHASHPEAGPMYKCAKCGQVVPVKRGRR